MSDQINERGLMVFEDVNSMPTYGTPYVSPYIVIGLNHQGWMKTSFDMKSVEFHPHDLAVVPSGHILLTYESSDDYTATLLVMSPRFLDKLNSYYTVSFEQIDFQYNSAFHLNDVQFENINRVFKMLKTISEMAHPDRDEILANQLEVGSFLIHIYILENNLLTTGDLSYNQQLLNRFKNALVKHFRESREVKYYASLLNLSPKYFGSVIKQQAGIAASEIIARFVIIQAKHLLCFRKDLSIQQISYQLGFSDPAAFSRFFKTNAKLSPKEYREQQLS